MQGHYYIMALYFTICVFMEVIGTFLGTTKQIIVGKVDFVMK